MEKIFGNKEIGFSIRCKKIQEESGSIFVKLVLRCKHLEMGEFESICHAGVVVHSAQIFLKYQGNRNFSDLNDLDLFNSLFLNTYGENWQYGLHNKLGPRFAVHEVFDISVGDEGWIIFLVDGATEASLLIGTRDNGFMSSVKMPINFVEDTIQNLIDWLS